MNSIIAVLAIVVCAFSAANATCPQIITRAGWGARAANTAVLPIRPAPFVVMHHTHGTTCISQVECSQQMRNIQNFHMNSNGWADIGYNWCVGQDGRAYEGRGWGRQGAHAPGYNNQSMGMCIIGTFLTVVPNAVARTAMQQLINCGVGGGHISGSYWLIGHRQAVATSCPGDAFFNEIRNWPRWNANPSPV